jgi:hypothetical protein
LDPEKIRAYAEQYGWQLPCAGCMANKNIRLPPRHNDDGLSSRNTAALGEIWHVDDHENVRSVFGNRWCLLYAEFKSLHPLVFFFKDKEDWPKGFRQFFVHLKHNRGKYVNVSPIRILRVDQGSFLVSNQARQIAAEFDCSIEAAAVKTQEQNWPAEKIWDVTRRASAAALFSYLKGSIDFTLKSQPQLKLTLWEAALKHECQLYPILNQYRDDSSVSIYQAFRGRDSHFDITRLRKFGAYAFPVHLEMPAMGPGMNNKFLSRSSLGIYIGWDEDAKAHRILSSKNQVLIVHHCIFLEHVTNIPLVMQRELPDVLQPTPTSKYPSYFAAAGDDEVPREISQEEAAHLFTKPVSSEDRRRAGIGSAVPPPPLLVEFPNELRRQSLNDTCNRLTSILSLLTLILL